MVLILKIMGSYCSTELFTINGILANSSDFGSSWDVCVKENYGCVNMQFHASPSSNKVLKKYKISTDEYSEICKKLKEGLSFGKCGWCV